MNIINDLVFGKMEYEHCWQKKEDIFLFGKKYKVFIVANAYTGQEISNAQRESYKWFGNCENWNNGSIEEALKKYLKDYYSYNNDDCNKIFNDNVDSMFQITTVLIQQEGNVLLLFEFLLDEENGLAVQIYPQIDVGSQDLFF